jgi:DNA-binding transcriptional ArsR family regulator
MARTAANSDVFHAVADATRRGILDLLCHGERAATELVAAFRMTQPAISQHLRVLRESSLVRIRKVGRQRMYSLDTDQLREVAQWIAKYERFWNERFER